MNTLCSDCSSENYICKECLIVFCGVAFPQDKNLKICPFCAQRIGAEEEEKEKTKCARIWEQTLKDQGGDLFKTAQFLAMREINAFECALAFGGEGYLFRLQVILAEKLGEIGG